MIPATVRLCSRQYCKSVMWHAWTHQACHNNRSSHVVAAASSSLTRKLRLAHIMLPLDKQHQLDDLEQQLKGGATFSDLARQHSTCPSGKAQGGDIGWMSPNQFPAGFEPVMMQAVGQLVRATTGRGHHLVMVLEEKQEAEVQHMSVQQLQELLSNPILCEEVQFIDVREQGEWQTAKLPYFKLMPLSQASGWAATIEEDLDPSMETVVLCHHGVRSMNAAMFLVSKGFTDVKNVTGGIAAYSRIDPSVPTY